MAVAGEKGLETLTCQMVSSDRVPVSDYAMVLP